LLLSKCVYSLSGRQRTRDTGEIVDHFGYTAAFLSLGAAALVAVIVFFLQMPETAEPEKVSPKA
jgi:hypothetical protein